jgi:mannose/fructose/N-acetylgalactosamine-specific phosphotransferase system component IIC
MQLLRLAIVIAATLAVAGTYLQELRRLAQIKAMPGHKARAYYEATRERSERMLTAITVGLAVMAVAAAAYAFVWPR